MEHHSRDLETALWLVVNRSPLLRAAFLAAESELAHVPWYVGGGCVAQMVWNVRAGCPPLEHVRDVDVAYFDPDDLSEGAEDAVAQRLRAAIVARSPVAIEPAAPPVDVKNQARVHEWYEERFGVPLQPYRSLEAAIRSWPTTASAIGLRRTSEEMVVFAPYGLQDVFDMVLRPNTALVTRTVYESKVERWRACWPDLTIVEW